MRSQNGREYPIVKGVPVLLRDDVPDTLWVASASLSAAWSYIRCQRNDALFLDTIGFSPEERTAARAQLVETDDAIGAVINYVIAATSGHLYRQLRGQLAEYPIPQFPLRGHGGRILDVGCNWGRWTISAARAGFRPVGIDPSLGAVLVAKRLCERLGVRGDFVVGDARWLPFRSTAFDTVYSYSVLQHFSRSDAGRTYAEFDRLLPSGGTAYVQMPNRLGVRCLYHQFRRGFAEGDGFDVRYWSLADLRELGSTIGPTELEIDGFFGLGVQPSDYEFMDRKGRMVIRASETLRRASRVAPLITRFADSVYLKSRKSDPSAARA